MSLNYVTLTLDLFDGQGNPLSQGWATLTPSATLTDATDNEWIPPAPIVAQFRNGLVNTVSLLATDNGNVAPAGWGWTISFTGVPGNPAPFSFFLPFSGGASQRLSHLAPVSSVVTMAAYMPLPTGPATAGYVPIAAGSGEISAWGPQAGGGGSLPLTTLGDTVYENATPAPARLPGNTSATKNFFTQTGNGSISAAPAWGTITAGDLPAATTSAQGAVVLDGTAGDIQALGAQAAGSTGKAADAAHVHPATGVVLTSSLPLSIGNGGTGQVSQQAAINALTGAQSAGKVLRSDGTNATLAAIQAADVPTLNQNTAGTAANVTATLDQIPAPVAAVSLNSKKITSLANGSAASDAAAFGQIPAALPPNGSASGDLGGSYPSPTVTATHLSSALPVNQGGTGQVTQQAALDALAGAQTLGQFLRGNGTHVQMSQIQAADLPYQPWQFSVAAYGAVGNGRFVTDAAMTSASATLTTGGLSAPAAPTVGNATAGGTIAVGTYQVEVTYVNAYGETVGSSSSSTTTTTATSTITITSPAAAGGAVAWYAYVTQVGTSTYTRQQPAGAPTAIGTNLTLTAPPSSGGANPPGANTTISSPFTVGDVGKTILVAGAGNAGGTATLVTTISAYVSASQVTLAANALATVTGVYTVWGTDDTTAVNSAVTAAVAYAKANDWFAEVVFTPAIYMIAGAPTQGGATLGNAQIPLPVLPMSGPKMTLRFKGAPESPAVLYGVNSTPLVTTGVTLVCGRADGSNNINFGASSVIGGPTFQATGIKTGTITNLRPVIDGINICLPYGATSTYCGFDFYGCTTATVLSGAVSALATPTQMANPPNGIPSGNRYVFGLRTPSLTNDGNIYIRQYQASGLGIGLMMSEHVYCAESIIFYCMTGLEGYSDTSGTPMTHCSLISYICCEANNSQLTFLETCKLDIMTLDVDAGAGSGTVTITDNNKGRGRVYVRGLGATQGKPTFSGTCNAEVYNADQISGVGGFSQPAVVAASTNFNNNFYRDAAVSVAAGTGVAISVDGLATGQASGTVIVPSGKNINLGAYSVAPTWAWVLL